MSRGEFHHAAKRQEGGVCEQEAGRRGAQQLPSHWPQSWGGGAASFEELCGAAREEARPGEGFPAPEESHVTDPWPHYFSFFLSKVEQFLLGQRKVGISTGRLFLFQILYFPSCRKGMNAQVPQPLRAPPRCALAGSQAILST